MVEKPSQALSHKGLYTQPTRPLLPLFRAPVNHISAVKPSEKVLQSDRRVVAGLDCVDECCLKSCTSRDSERAGWEWHSYTGSAWRPWFRGEVVADFR